MNRRMTYTVAAIDVGSHLLRMMIAEINEHGEINVLENLYKPAHIGSDTFSYGRIEMESIYEACDALKGFFQVMQQYKVTDYRAVATSGIREAENSEYVLELIRLRTGLKVDIINNSQERYLMYKAISKYIPAITRADGQGILTVNIGAGGVEITAYKDGQIALIEYVKVGSLRLTEVLADLERLTFDFPSVMEEFIRCRIDYIEPYIRSLHITSFAGMGGELVNIYKLVDVNNRMGAQKRPNDVVCISKNSLHELYKTIHTMTTEQIVDGFALDRSQAELLLPSIITFKLFLDMTEAEEIVAPIISLRNGILADMAEQRTAGYKADSSKSIIIDSVWCMGKKFNIDRTHSEYIQNIALRIYDQARNVHGLDNCSRLYLQVAAILHDVGKHVNVNRHDIHSYNIIRFQNFIGLSDRELAIIANITRYHSEEAPDLQHENYRSLTREDQIIVSKLTAILKLAEALDISHKKKIDKLEITLSSREILFRINTSKGMLLEEWNFNNSGIYFQQVMGLRPVIKCKG